MQRSYSFVKVFTLKKGNATTKRLWKKPQLFLSISNATKLSVHSLQIPWGIFIRFSHFFFTSHMFKFFYFFVCQFFEIVFISSHQQNDRTSSQSMRRSWSSYFLRSSLGMPCLKRSHPIGCHNFYFRELWQEKNHGRSALHHGNKCWCNGKQFFLFCCWLSFIGYQ